MNRYRMTCAAALLAMVLAGAVAVPVRAADSADQDIIARGSQWMSVRFGYAKGTGDAAPDGLMGGGFGYRRFVLDKWSVGGFVHYDWLGRFGSATDISAPITVEAMRHSHWGANAYPYVGFGVGAFYYKQYRTDADVSGFTPGRYLACGLDVPVRKQGLLGLDVRLAQVDRQDDNPVFAGPNGERRKIDELLKGLAVPSSPSMPLLFNQTEKKSRTLWSAKLSYTIAY